MVSVDDLIRDLRNASLGHWRPALYSESAEALTTLQSRVIELEELGRFLVARIDNLEWSCEGYDDLVRDWIGHVDPALSRFTKALSNTANSGGIAK